MIGFITFLVILGIMVLIHELGHFIAAKACGVRVEAFAIGFGKRLFGVVHNGTDYRINALPLGGYVKMAGQDEMPSSIEQTIATPDGNEASTSAETVREDGIALAQHAHGVKFTDVTRWQRMLIAIAGPVANFILALVVLLFVCLFHYERAEFLEGPAVVDYVAAGSAAAKAGLSPGDTLLGMNDQANPNWQNVVEQAMLNMRRSVPLVFAHNGQRREGHLYIDSVEDPLDLFDKVGFVPREQTGAITVHEVQADTPAAKAGLRAGDRIDAIDGLHLHSVRSLLLYLSDRAGKPSVLSVLRNGASLTLPVTPEVGLVTETRKQYRLGFRPEPVPSQVVRLPFGAAVAESWKQTLHVSVMTVQVLKGLVTHHVSMKVMSGPVGIEQQVSDAARQGFWEVANFTAAISLNLGIFNLLPMPILDGGLILFLVIESIARRDVKPVVKERVYQAAFVCIILFFAFVMWNDISRLPFFTHHPG